MQRIILLLLFTILSSTAFTQTFRIDVDKKRGKPGETFRVVATIKNSSDKEYVVPTYFNVGFAWKRGAKHRFGIINPLETHLYSNEVRVKFLKAGPSLTTLLAVGAGLLLLLLALSSVIYFIKKEKT